MKTHLRLPTAWMVLTVLVVPLICQAQWRTQTIPLQPGWNAVHLEVQPEPRILDEIFTELPVESVWKWDRRFTSIQFSLDPNTLIEENPDWLVWLPSSNSKAFLNRLHLLQGNQSYLVKVNTNAAPFTVDLKGEVILPRLDWYPHGLNLVGLPVSSVNPPTFSDFFEFTPEVDTSLGFQNELYRLDSLGRGLRIVQPNRDTIQPGVAYWVGADRKIAHISALHVTPQGGAVDFGFNLFEQDLSIKNTHPSASVTAQLHQRVSEPAPTSGQHPELAGPVPLSYITRNASNVLKWVDFPASGLSRALAPGEEWIVRLGVRRDELTPYTPSGTNGANHQSILEVTDASQSLMIRVPLVASDPEPGLLGDSLDSHDDNEGLWVGEVTLNQVNAPAYTTNLMGAPPASLRLLVHVDAYGNARLLQQVALAWDKTLTDPPHTNGTYALYADARDLPADAEDVKRISSVAFPTMAPVLMTGTFGVTTNTLDTTININFDDPTNPFLHRYHPLHDNKDFDGNAYTNAIEVPTIVREIALSFTSVTNEAAHPIWGVDAVVGTYAETLSGLRAQSVVVRGGFALQRISRINELQGIAP